MPRPNKFNARLRFDRLEAREVPTVVSMSNGLLTITGTDGADTITIKQTPTETTVSGVTGSFETPEFTRIVINSGAGNDTITLNQAGFVVTKPAVIRAGAGNDTVFGGAAADYIDGEAGNDRLHGGDGADQIAGDVGDDKLYGNAGNDSLAGGAGNDNLYGGSGVDRIWGGTDFDYVEGGAGMDHVYDDFAFWAVQINDTDYVHHHILGLADNSGFGWFDANLPDPDIRRRARAEDRDGSLSRSDVISLFTQATDGSTVNSDEFNSLNALVHTDQVSMNAPARYFGKKIIDGDPANQWYTGGSGTRHALGNLHAGDSDDHLQKLIDKWFLGKDHPMAKSFDRSTTYGYQEAHGSLKVDGFKPEDVMQGDVGDCGFLAALGAVARKNPSRITNMFTANDDGTYTVRLYKDGHAEYVTVDRQLPVDGNGNLVFASPYLSAADTHTELWVALAEKAYAQANESGWLGQDGTNSYNGIGGALANPDENYSGISGVFPADALNHLTGSSTSGAGTGANTFADVKAAFDAGKAVVFSSKESPVSPDVVGAHGYMMVGYDATHHTITVRNPWGDGFDQPTEITMTSAFAQANFDSWVAAKA